MGDNGKSERKLREDREKDRRNIEGRIRRRSRSGASHPFFITLPFLGGRQSARDVRLGEGIKLSARQPRASLSLVFVVVAWLRTAAPPPTSAAEAARWLLAHGASPNLRNANGATPLHFAHAVEHAPTHDAIVALLRDGGADAAISGRSSLWAGKQTAARLLGEPPPAGERGAAANADASGATTLPRPLSFNELSRLGSEIAFDNAAYAPLVLAARHGDADAVRAWCACHAAAMDVDGPPGRRGTSALAHAASGGSLACLRILLDAGALVEHGGAGGANALHYATFKMHRACAERLLAAPGARAALAARGTSAL